MPSNIERFSVFRGIDAQIMDESMTDALPTADIEVQRLITAMLIKRSNPNGLMGLIRHYHVLDGGLQHQINREVVKLASILRSASRVSDSQTVSNIIDIIDRTGAVDLTYLLAELMPVTKPEVSERCANSLLDLLTYYFKRVPKEAEERSEPYHLSHESLLRYRTQIIEALTYSARHYGRHRQRGVVEGMMFILGRRDKTVLDQLTDPNNNLLEAVSVMVRSPSKKYIQKNLFLLANIKAYEQAATQGLSASFSDDSRDLVMETSFLTVLPNVKEALYNLSNVNNLLAPTMKMEKAPAFFCRRALRLTRSMRMSNKEKLTIYSKLLESKDRVTRLLTLKAISRINDQLADELMMSMLYDPELPIARLALRFSRRVSGPMRKTLNELMDQCPHPELRVMHQGYSPAGPFEELWGNWKSMDADTRLVYAHRVMSRDPMFILRLSDKVDLNNLKNPNNQQALDMIRMTGLNQSVVHILQEFMQCNDDRLASDAIRAISSVRHNEEIMEILAGALNHPSDRVKGNAIEGLQTHGGLEAHLDTLRSIARLTKQNRSRATAIKVLLELGERDAEKYLSAMLKDEQPRHRVSALWVVRSLNLHKYKSYVEQIHKNDPSASLRIRARGVLGELTEVQLVGQSRASEAEAETAEASE